MPIGELNKRMSAFIDLVIRASVEDYPNSK